MRKKTQFSLRFIMLTTFVTLFGVMMAFLMAINYFQTSKSLLVTAQKLMHEVTASLYSDFVNELELASEDNYFTSELLKHQVLNPNDPTKMVTYLMDMAQQFHIMQAIYWGDTHGNFVSAEYESDLSVTSEIANRDIKPPSHYFLYHNSKGEVIKRVDNPILKYDPRTRPWYIEAKKAGKTIWTDVYEFSAKPLLGVTMATPVYWQNGAFRGVLGLDLRLDWFSSYVSAKRIGKEGVVFVVSADGKVIAYPGFEKTIPHAEHEYLHDIHAISIPWVAASFDTYTKHKREEFHFTYHGEEYLAVFKKIPHFATKGWLIGAVAPAHDFTAELKKALIINVFLGIFVLMVAVLALSALITRVVRPLKRLVKQTEKIKHFDLAPTKSVDSKITEIMLLSNAISAMSRGLLSFQKYVPASFVRQLIETGEDARIGGIRRELVVLFTDIEGFTSIAENMSPDILLEYMCGYFEVLSQVITSEKGTIDKYIGDSVMAFWGAPVLIDAPAHHAARAALESLRVLDAFNTLWSARGRSALVTRIGIHQGDAIVGNVGSSEHMNYTALGNTINVAQRLEGVNKIYDTSIIVSQEVYEELHEQFVLRMIDYVTLKGKTNAEYIYELVAATASELVFDLKAYNAMFGAAFAAYQAGHWLEAMHLFKQCLEIYIDDRVAHVFIKRCQHFQIDPPENWEGVWRL